MPRSLHCEATDCLHNKDEKCYANVIQVNGGATNRGRDTYCNSYVASRDSYTDSAESLKNSLYEAGTIDTEFGNDIIAPSGNAPKVTCTAGKCVYNSRYYCYAKNLHVEAPREDSMRCECRTFRPK